ncbi:DegV family protein [Alkalibacter saccharofermentans]|uniref:EDD domain protein, DegV family n=1 Tax=Alkalibacter saccharofermentans DSM 14828 TaxID=1120975 RepID=A0A1M4U9U8_9FIRM|nr:DegV family protein [Alkalibacter saccharofermentans]SHE53542.1 EDD domain protein, DegV family [Alkalibacter saccharofermentans DSM 14828]
MDYKIVVGSSCDFDEAWGTKIPHSTVPFTITIGDEDLVDDESLTVETIIEKMKKSVGAIKTACPSPNHFLEKYKEAENIFVVTISSNLSGTYNSAITAKDMYTEQYGEKFIHIFDSLSAAIAETMIAIKITELADQDNSLPEIVSKVESYIGEMKTMFVLENLDNLIKNGRMSKLTGMFAQFLHIKPILGADEHGEIKLIEKARGSKNALKKLVDLIGSETDFSDKRLGIVHCNALEKAQSVKEMIMEKYNFKDVVLTEANGLSAVYMDDGGIVISY